MIRKLDWYQWLKYIHLSFGRSGHLEEFSMLVFIVKTVYCSKKKSSRDMGSPDSHQLLQLQLSSQIFKILDPLCWFYLALFYCFPELGCSFATILDFPGFELSSIVYHFWRMNDYFLSTNAFDYEVWSFWLMDWFPLSLSEIIWTVN